MGMGDGPAAKKVLVSEYLEQQTRLAAEAAEALKATAVKVRLHAGASFEDASAAVAAAAASGAIDWDLLSGKKAPQYTPPGSPNSPPGSPKYWPPGSPNSPPVHKKRHAWMHARCKHASVHGSMLAALQVFSLQKEHDERCGVQDGSEKTYRPTAKAARKLHDKEKLPEWAQKTPEFAVNWKLLKRLLQLTSVTNKKKSYELKLRRGFNALFVKNSRVVLAPDEWTANIAALMSTYEQAKAAAATKLETKKRK